MQMQIKKRLIASLPSISLLVSGALIYTSVMQQNEGPAVEKYKLASDLDDQHTG